MSDKFTIYANYVGDGIELVVTCIMGALGLVAGIMFSPFALLGWLLEKRRQI